MTLRSALQALCIFIIGAICAIALHLWTDEKRVYYVQIFTDGTMPLVIESVDSQTCKQLAATMPPSRDSATHCVPRNLALRADMVEAEQRGLNLQPKQ